MKKPFIRGRPYLRLPAELTEARLLRALVCHGPMSTELLWQKAGTSRQPTYNAIQDLIRDGILRRQKTGTIPRTLILLTQPHQHPALALANRGLDKAQALGLAPGSAATMREISDYYRRAAAILEELG